MLDLGTGTGVAAIAAARSGAVVVAVDVNPSAVLCARLNARQNGVEGRVDVRPGDLFEPVGDERFDLVLFNPPFYRGAPRSAMEAAWRGEDVLERFVAQLGRHLRPFGAAQVVVGTEGRGNDLLALLHRQGYRVELSRPVHLGTERLAIATVRAESRDEDAGPL